MADITAAIKLVPMLFPLVDVANSWFRGRRLLVLGHEGAGKTSFYDVLRHNLFANHHENNHTIETKRHWPYTKSDGDRRFRVSTSHDIPGNLSTSDQIELVRLKRPEVLMIFLSSEIAASKPGFSSIGWFKSFAVKLTILLARDSGVARRLRCVAVVLNKIDKVREETARAMEDDVRKIAHEHLEAPLRQREIKWAIFPCTLNDQEGGTKAVSRILLEVS